MAALSDQEVAKKTAVKEAKRAGAVKVDKMKEDYNQ